MKKPFLFLSLLCAGTAFSQVGINTTNPQTIFHVDGAKDNPDSGTPTQIQQENDFSITDSGNVGVGTTVPQRKMHVNGSLQFTGELNIGGDGNTAGDAGQSGQVLTSNGPGQTPSWKNNAPGNLLEISALALKENISQQTSPPNTLVTILYESVPKQDSLALAYNHTTGKFIFFKEGYYLISSASSIDMHQNAPNETSGTCYTYILKDNESISASSSYHEETTLDVFHTTVGMAYFHAGAVMEVKMSMTRNFRISRSSLSIIYLGT